MINSRTLSWLPPGACFINAGRGDLVDEEGLVEALDRGSLAGAALDVFETEPLPQESILWTHIPMSTSRPTLPASPIHRQHAVTLRVLSAVIDRTSPGHIWSTPGGATDEAG